MVKLFKGVDIPAAALVVTALLIGVIIFFLWATYKPFQDLVGFAFYNGWAFLAFILLALLVWQVFKKQPEVVEWVPAVTRGPKGEPSALELAFTQYHLEDQIVCERKKLRGPLQVTPLPNSGRWHIQPPSGWMGNNPGIWGIIIQAVKGRKEMPGFYWGHTDMHYAYPLRQEIIDKLDKVSDPTIKTLKDYAKLQATLKPVIEEHNEQIA